MKKLSSILFIYILSLAVNNNTFSQVTTIPAGTGPYANLGAAFTAINAGGVYLAVDIYITITANIVEPAPAQLNGGYLGVIFINPSGARTISASFNEAIIVLNGAGAVFIDGLNTGGNSLTLTNTNVGTSAGCFRLSNGAQNNELKNLTCNAVGGININIAQSTNGTFGNNFNQIIQCTINGGRRGIQTFGTNGNGTFGYYNEDTSIKGNTIKNCRGAYIFLGSYTKNNICEMNHIFSDSAVTNEAGGTRGILVQGVGSNIVRKNKIYSLTGTVAGGFYGISTIPVNPNAPLTAPAQTTIEVTNNFVALDNTLAAAPFVYGVYSASNFSTVNYTVNIYFNSIRIMGTSGATPGALTIALAEYLDGLQGADTARIYNNLCINERTGGDVSSLHIGSDLNPENGVSLEADFNTVFAKDTTGRGWDAGYNGSLFRGSSGMNIYHDTTCAAEIEQSSIFSSVNFVSATDLHLTGSFSWNMNAMLISPTINTDIDGESRAITSTNLFTYRGADEHIPDGSIQWKKTLKRLKFSIQGISPTESPRVNAIKKAITTYIKSSGGVVQCIIEIIDIVIDIIDLFLPISGGVDNGSSYYLEIASSNSVRTFTATPILCDSSTYDFTTSLGQAFGGNMFGTSAPFRLYTGDVNQDDIIDGSDGAEVDNDASNFAIGCSYKTDVNGDGIVDGSDGVIVDNNASNFVGAVIPTFRGPLSIQNPLAENTKNSTMRKPTNILITDNVSLSN